MKQTISYLSILILTLTFLHACGPSEEELRQQEAARLDSLQQVYQAQMEQMRLDSLEQANEDTMESEEEENEEFEFSDDGLYTIQIEAWRSREKAEAQAERWRERGYDRAYVIEYGDEDSGDIWYRVRLGRFDTREMAANFKEMLARDYDKEAWISELRN